MTTYICIACGKKANRCLINYPFPSEKEYIPSKHCIYCKGMRSRKPIFKALARAHATIWLRKQGIK